MQQFKLILLSFSLMLVFAFQASSPRMVLNAQKIAISRNQPFTMTMELQAGEELGIEVFYEEGRASLEDLTITFEGQGERQRSVASNARQTFLAKKDGFYQIGLELERKKINVGFKLYSNKPFELEPGETKNRFVITSGFLGVNDRTPESHATFTFGLEEGQSVQIQSNNPENIYYNYTTDLDGNIQHWITENLVFPIEEDGNYTFRLYIDEPKEVQLVKFVEFIKSRKGLDLTNLVFNISVPGDGGGGSGPGDGQANFEDVLAEIEEQQKARDKENQEAMERLIKEINDKDTVAGPLYISNSGGSMQFPMDEELSILRPVLDLKNSDGPCECNLLDVTFGTPEFWVYWIGVGEKALEKYQSRQELFRGRAKDPLLTLPQIYAEKMLLGENPETNLPASPGSVFPSDFDEEKIEYAILDEQGKNAFLLGESYSSISSGFMSKGMAFDFGNGIVDMTQSYYLCTRNHYAYSPVSYVFIYETFYKNR